MAALLTLGACSLLEEPVGPWQKDIIYNETGKGVLSASPLTVRVDGPWGYIVLTNETAVERGFAMDGPAIYEEIRSEATRRIRVDELEDGDTYAFYDHLHPDDPLKGTVVVRYVAEEQR